jgi:hypothetical protein
MLAGSLRNSSEKGDERMDDGNLSKRSNLLIRGTIRITVASMDPILWPRCFKSSSLSLRAAGPSWPDRVSERGDQRRGGSVCSLSSSEVGFATIPAKPMRFQLRCGQVDGDSVVVDADRQHDTAVQLKIENLPLCVRFRLRYPRTARRKRLAGPLASLRPSVRAMSVPRSWPGLLDRGCSAAP